MALPMNATPTYTLTVPSSKENVKFRPFLVKEEKALLIAQQSEDAKVMVDTLKQVITSCVQTKLDVDNLATFDLEYIFSQIRAKSVGETIELIFPCDVCDDEKAKVKISFDVSKVQVFFPEGHDKKVELFNDVGVVMRYPSLEIIKKIENIEVDDVDSIFDVVSECIEIVYTADEVFHTRDQSKQEVLEFLGNLTTDQFNKIQRFFETMPRLKQEVKYSCPLCKKPHEKVLEGLDSFF